VPRVNYAMEYRPENSFSMSYASRKVIFPGASIVAAFMALVISEALNGSGLESKKGILAR